MGAQTRRMIAIINPLSRSGQTTSLESTLKRRFGSALVTMHRTRAKGEATTIARNACCQGFDTVIAIGGDGTINEIINGIVDSEVSLGIIPAGTANDLASHLGIPANVGKACDIIMDNKPRRVDVLSVNGWCFITAGGIGLPAVAVSLVGALKNHPLWGRSLSIILGNKIYLLALLAAYRRATKSALNFTISMNGRDFVIGAYSIIFANQPFIGKHFYVSPPARNDDAKLDIFLITDQGNPGTLLSAVTHTLNGSQGRCSNVLMFRTDHVCLETQRPSLFFGDGEVRKPESQYEISVRPGAVKIIAPAKEECR